MSNIVPFQSVALFENTFRHQINKESGKIEDRKFVFQKKFGDGPDNLPTEPDRYRLIWMPGCPHSNKAVITLRLLGLDKVISIGECGILRDPRGWVFSEDLGEVDPVLKIHYLDDAYLKGDPDFTGRSTVPAIADVTTGAIVQNEAWEIPGYLVTDWEAFHKELPDCHVITYRKATIVVCSTTDAEKVGKLLDLFPANCSVNVGISNPFHKIELLREALSEAEDALATGKSIDPERRIFPFEEFSISIMLRHFSETEDLTRYIHPAVLLLLKYDDQYKSKLLPTIREYITNNCSIKKTAEALFLHRNSVIYRLHKAEEISGLILNDPDTQFILRMSFLIMRTAPQTF